MDSPPVCYVRMSAVGKFSTHSFCTGVARILRAEHGRSGKTIEGLWRLAHVDVFSPSLSFFNGVRGITSDDFFKLLHA